MGVGFYSRSLESDSLDSFNLPGGQSSNYECMKQCDLVWFFIVLADSKSLWPFTYYDEMYERAFFRLLSGPKTTAK